MRFIICRHAATQANERRLVQGQKTNLPLSKLGEQQAGHLARALAKDKVTAIYSSPLERALETARVISSQFVYGPSPDVGLPVRPNALLQEIDVGDCEGWPIDALQNAFPLFWQEWEGDGDVQWPNGESVSDVTIRVSEFLEEIKGCYPDDTIVIVSHATVVASLLALGLGLSLGGYRQLWLDVGHYSILETQGRTDGYACGTRGMSLKLHNA